MEWNIYPTRVKMSNKNRTLIIIPMKDPSQSKTRLNQILTDDKRKYLSKKLFKRTLDFLKKTIKELNKIDKKYKIAVVTESEEISKIALNENVLRINSTGMKSLSESIDFASEWAKEKCFSRLCIIPADLIELNSNDFYKLLNHPIKNNSIVICPAKDLGTNALMVSPVNGIKFSYGPKSFLKHLEEAKKRKINSVILPLSSLKFDLDTIKDLNNVLNNNPSFLKKSFLDVM